MSTAAVLKLQITGSIDNVNTGVRSTAEDIHSVSQNAKQLKESTIQLNVIVKQFKLD
ncbi:MAG: hypothetical protein GX640_03240 [Fibrobacter sp.]|nr:hypothetical protein [Fibrobacter sp.]